jgi:hypothetical protein
VRPRPLTRRQRQMLRDAYEHMMTSGGGRPGWQAAMSPCPRIGDVRVLSGLALRELMTDGDNGDGPHAVLVWPRWIRITPAGVAEWERLLADSQPKDSAS